MCTFRCEGYLSHKGLFDNVTYTAEDRKRRDFYASQVQRTKLMKSSSNLEQFYRSLSMKLTSYNVKEAEIPRVSQLTQRTNQFNMTTRRYSETEILQFCNDPYYLVKAYGLKDRYGDNGIVSVAIVHLEDQSAYIDTFLMSCRVIGRTVETAILSLLVQELNDRRVEILIGRYIPTEKNKPVKQTYSDHGFQLMEKGTDSETYKYQIGKQKIDVPAWIETLQRDRENNVTFETVSKVCK